MSWISSDKSKSVAMAPTIISTSKVCKNASDNLLFRNGRNNSASTPKEEHLNGNYT